jgi:hypothetical protein
LVAVQGKWRRKTSDKKNREKWLLPVLANEEDGLTQKDHAEQPVSSAAFGPLWEIGWRQERENRTEAVLTRKTSKRTLDTLGEIT